MLLVKYCIIYIIYNIYYFFLIVPPTQKNCKGHPLLLAAFSEYYCYFLVDYKQHFSCCSDAALAAADI